MNKTIDNAPAEQVSRGGKFLSFQLSKEEYGIAILKVREIIGTVDITSLPRTPDYVLGVVNLRGRIIPVIDLRRKFGLEPKDFTNETCIVVVDCGGDADSSFRVGCIVDSVSEVLSIDDEDFEEAPRCANTSSVYIDGLAKLKDRVLILLDIDKVIGDIDPASLTSGVEV